MESANSVKSLIDHILTKTGTSVYHEILIYGDGGDPMLILDGDYSVETLEKACSLLRLAQNEILSSKEAK